MRWPRCPCVSISQWPQEFFGFSQKPWKHGWTGCRTQRSLVKSKFPHEHLHLLRLKIYFSADLIVPLNFSTAITVFTFVLNSSWFVMKLNFSFFIICKLSNNYSSKHEMSWNTLPHSISSDSSQWLTSDMLHIKGPFNPTQRHLSLSSGHGIESCS